MSSEKAPSSALFPEIPRRLNELDQLIATGGGDARLQVEIDNAMKALSDTAVQLRSRRNACSPLLRLPGELLSNILIILENVDPPEVGYVMAATDPSLASVAWHDEMGWLRMCHVCRALRMVLMQRADMWARNIHRFPQIQNDVLARCGNHPLTLCLNSASASAAAAGKPLRFVLENLGRAGSLSIIETHLPLDTWPVDPAILLRQPLQFLEHLNIQLLLCQDDERLKTLTSDICALPPLDAPLLETLTLREYMISFSTATLTQLSITFLKPLYLHSPRQFSDLLHAGTRLEYLELRNCIPLFSERKDDSGERLMLPKLMKLCMEDSTERCLSLWRYLTVLPEAHVILYFNDVAESYPAHNSHLEVMSQHFRDWSTCPATGLTVCEHASEDYDAPHSRDLSIHLLAPCPGACIDNWDGGPFERDYSELRKLWFSKIDTVRPHFIHALSTAHTITDVSTITALELDTHYVHDASTWSSMLAPLASLETLYIENPATVAVITALTVAEDDVSLLILPHLKCLWLNRLDVVEDGDGGTRTQMIRMLTSRARRGAKLERFRIDNLRVDREAAERTLVPRLQSVVPSFEYTISDTKTESVGALAQGHQNLDSDSDLD